MSRIPRRARDLALGALWYGVATIAIAGVFIAQAIEAVRRA